VPSGAFPRNRGIVVPLARRRRAGRGGHRAVLVAEVLSIVQAVAAGRGLAVGSRLPAVARGLCSLTLAGDAGAAALAGLQRTARWVPSRTALASIARCHSIGASVISHRPALSGSSAPRMTRWTMVKAPWPAAVSAADEAADRRMRQIGEEFT